MGIHITKWWGPRGTLGVSSCDQKRQTELLDVGIDMRHWYKYRSDTYPIWYICREIHLYAYIYSISIYVIIRVTLHIRRIELLRYKHLLSYQLILQFSMSHQDISCHTTWHNSTLQVALAAKVRMNRIYAALMNVNGSGRRLWAATWIQSYSNGGCLSHPK